MMLGKPVLGNCTGFKLRGRTADCELKVLRRLDNCELWGFCRMFETCCETCIRMWRAVGPPAEVVVQYLPFCTDSVGNCRHSKVVKIVSEISFCGTSCFL